MRGGVVRCQLAFLPNSTVCYWHASEPAHLSVASTSWLHRTERVKPSCKSGITSDVTGRITHLAYLDRIVPQTASTPWQLPRPASSLSSSSRHSTTSTTFCLPFTRTAHTFDPLTAAAPAPPLQSLRCLAAVASRH